MLRSGLVIVGAFVAGVLLGWFAHTSDPATQSQPSRDSVPNPEPERPLSTQQSLSQQATPNPSNLDEPALQTAIAQAASPTSDFQSAADETSHADREQLFPGGNFVTGHADTRADAHDRSKLESTYRISCQFNSGVNAQLSEGAIQRGDASWQGGAIIFDVLNANEGRATMSGTEGATGSSTGVADVRMARTDAGLSFSGLVPRGDLISTTIFAQRNAGGEFLAVMSTHAARSGHMASQFYGSCLAR